MKKLFSGLRKITLVFAVALFMLLTIGISDTQAAINIDFNGSVSQAGTNFGGSGYCDYHVDLTNIVQDISLSSDLSQVAASSINGTHHEAGLNSCPYATLPTTTFQYTMTSQSVVGSNVSIQYSSVQNPNYPQGNASFTGTINGVTISGTLVFKRTDSSAPVINWTLSAPIVLTQVTVLQCSYFNETFTETASNTWSYLDATWAIKNGKVNVSQIISGAIANYDTYFYPDDYFTIDVDVEAVSFPQGGAYGIYPYTSGSTYFTVDGKSLDGIGAVFFSSGNAYLIGWDVTANAWYQSSNKYITTPPVTSIGVAYSSDAVTLRINKQNTTLKFSGNFTDSWWPIDSLKLVAQGTGTNVNFDNVCADPLVTAPTPVPQSMPMPVSQEVFVYTAVEIPSTDATPSLAKPIGVGTVANKGNTYSLKVDTGQFAGPVDLYLAYLPAAKDNNLYLIDSNNNPTQAIVPWRTGVTSATESLFGDVDLASWPRGAYYLGLLALPSGGDFSSYYFWITGFEIGVGTISLDPSNTDTIVSGTYQITDGKSISFSSKALGTEKAEASYKVIGGTDTVDIKIDSKATGTIVINGASMTGYGALTNANSTALSKIASGDLGQSLAMIPLEIGCKSETIDPAVLAALIMPLQMFIKYQTPDTSNFMKQYLAKTSCKYFNEAGGNSDSRPAPQSLIVSEDYFPNVFYYFPFDEIGSASSSAAASASMRRSLRINGLFDIPVYSNDKISERIQRTEFDPLYPTAEGQKFGSCGSRCRGACGVNCPSTCNIIYTWECILDDKGRNTGDSTAFTTYECGAHDGCEHHDTCYDSCLKEHGCGTWRSSNCMHNFYNGCDREAGEIYGYANCASEALGRPPYDKILTFKYAGEIVVNDVACYPYYYDVYATADIGGFISPSNANVYKGETASFTVTPETGYNIASVTGCGGTLTGSTYTTGPITAICTVSATFKLVSVITYTVTASAGAGGTISPSSATVKSGSTTSFTVTPNTGYSIASVTGCGGTLTGSTYTTGPITAICTVSATFKLVSVITSTVTASAGTGGTISPSSKTVNSGSTASFIVTPNTGYSIASVTGCGGTLTGSTYTTGPITAACTVSATFALGGPDPCNVPANQCPPECALGGGGCY